jgi:hypothetical protein
MKPFLLGGAAGPGGTPEAGKAGGIYNKGFHTGISPFQIGTLGTFFTGGDNEFPLARDSGSQGFPQAHEFGIVKTFKIIQAYTQGYLGVYLVYVLAARPAGTGKIRPCGAMYGLIQKNRIHLALCGKITTFPDRDPYCTAFFSASTLSVFSQGNSLLPKWP